MKQTKTDIMGMPITIEILGEQANETLLVRVFDFFKSVDEKYSTYKKDSEISLINNGLPRDKWSKEIVNIFALCEKTKIESYGYFDIENMGSLDPSGLVKGWSINKASEILISEGADNFYINAGGDIQVRGNNYENMPWTVGIRNPFNDTEIIKILEIRNAGVATSGNYSRGNHIYNPYESKNTNSIVSLTVIGPNIYDADRFATAAFAMGDKAARFIEKLTGFEAYMIDENGLATYTSGFDNYVVYQ